MTPPRAVRLLTVADLAARWGTTRNGIYAAKKRGRVPPPIRPGGQVRGRLLWNERDVEAYERDHLVPA